MIPIEYNFQYKNESATQLLQTDAGVFLVRLFGVDCSNCTQYPGSSLFGGLLHLDTQYGSINTDKLAPIKCANTRNELTIIWEIESGLQIKSSWSFCSETGVIHRRDSLKNNSNKPIRIFTAKSRFTFSPGKYDIYSQASSWCNENQGSWQTLKHGCIRLACEGGRTTQGGTPFAVLKEGTTGKAIAFHLLPFGNWNIDIIAFTYPGNPFPYIVLEAGMADGQLRFEILPGKMVDFPELLLFDASSSDGSCYPIELDFNSWKLHTYYIKNIYKIKFREPPVVYNTWFDVFEFLDVSRLRSQLKIAKNMGCEVFVVDAGWYGRSEGDWHSQAGDWREKINAAFHGKMLDFSREVRNEGLEFGLWMEPERVSKQSPVYQEHPDWFIPGGSRSYYYDLTKPEAFSYIYNEICRLIETYSLAWMKIDFNFDLGLDSSGWEFKKYYDAWYSLLAQVRSKYPGLFLEGCSSGAMRLDLNTLRHFDGHFLSDNVNPWDVLSIYCGALLRLPPGLLTKWATIRSTCSNIVKYGVPLSEAPRAVITPEGATWDGSCTVNTDFPLKVAMMGIMGLSGDFSGLSKNQVEIVSSNIDFYKKWRNFIYSSRGYLLTPPAVISNRSGWVGIQLQNPDSGSNLIFCYRLNDLVSEKYFYLRGLNENYKYRICEINIDDTSRQGFCIHRTGISLARDGILVKIKEKNNGTIFLVEPD